MNNDTDNIFGKYMLILEQEQIQQSQSQGKPLGNLIGAKGGGEGGNWGGSLPKLISLLPFGNWKASSLKRPMQNTRSGFMSDHYEGNSIAYAADFGLNTTFGSRVEDATRFAIAVARNAGKSIDSWDQFKGNSFNHNTTDGYRVQIIWQSNVGGNHYDHVHVGVRKGAGAVKYNGSDNSYQDLEANTGNVNKAKSLASSASGSKQGETNANEDPLATTPESAKDKYMQAADIAKVFFSKFGSKLA